MQKGKNNIVVKAKQVPPPLPPLSGSVEASDWSDYAIGTLFVAIGTVLAVLLGWFYWNVHGGSVDNFSLWAVGDKKWLEVLFWSFFTVHAWNITDSASAIWDGKFQKRFVWFYIGRMFETPPISLALVFIVINLGVAFGDTTISLKEAPIIVIIAFAIVSAYFSREAVDTLQEVAKWFIKQVKGKLNPEEEPQDK